jgi:hypothetical protein
MPLQIVDSAAEAPSSNESTAPGLLPGENHFPALFFLDSSYFQQTKSQLQMPTLELPPEFDSIDAQSNMHDVDVYFNSIHTFLPIGQSILQHLLCCSWQQHVRLL